ncbi:unnamed protein product [Calypogeia fissa]
MAKVAPDLYKDYVAQIMDVQGLPLGLVVVGGFMKQKGDLCAQEIKAGAMSLDGNKHDRLWSVMELAFERLQEEERQMFLDIATNLLPWCGVGSSKTSLEMLWLGNNSCSWLDKLDTEELGNN